MNKHNNNYSFYGCFRLFIVVKFQRRLSAHFAQCDVWRTQLKLFVYLRNQSKNTSKLNESDVASINCCVVLKQRREINNNNDIHLHFPCFFRSKRSQFIWKSLNVFSFRCSTKRSHLLSTSGVFAYLAIRFYSFIKYLDNLVVSITLRQRVSASMTRLITKIIFLTTKPTKYACIQY